jgi:hypothetical protein
MQSYLCFHYTITALTEANMATINDLPCELLLDIFDSHILSGFDILRVAQTCQRWRSIFSGYDVKNLSTTYKSQRARQTKSTSTSLFAAFLPPSGTTTRRTCGR